MYTLSSSSVYIQHSADDLSSLLWLCLCLRAVKSSAPGRHNKPSLLLIYTVLLSLSLPPSLSPSLSLSLSLSLLPVYSPPFPVVFSWLTDIFQGLSVDQQSSHLRYAAADTLSLCDVEVLSAVSLYNVQYVERTVFSIYSGCAGSLHKWSPDLAHLSSLATLLPSRITTPSSPCHHGNHTGQCGCGKVSSVVVMCPSMVV